MTHKGRALESLVALFEQVLSPSGATVKTPEFIEDRITGDRTASAGHWPLRLFRSGLRGKWKSPGTPVRTRSGWVRE